MNRRVTLRLAPALTLVILLSNFAFPIAQASVGKEPAAPAAIRITPPAPVFEDAKRLNELAARRKRVAETIGSKGILVMFSAEPRVYTNDVDYQFRQENNLYYLTNLGQRGATLVLMLGNPQFPEVLFLPRRNPARETWTGHMYSPEEAAALSGVREIWEATEFEPFVAAIRNHQSYRPKDEKVFMSAAPANKPGAGFEALLTAAAENQAELYLLAAAGPASKEYGREQRFAADWNKAATGFTLKNAAPIFAEGSLASSPGFFRPIFCHVGHPISIEYALLSQGSERRTSTRGDSNTRSMTAEKWANGNS